MRTAAILLVMILLLPACATVDALLGSGPRPSAALKGVSIGQATLSAVGLDFEVEVTNPYDVPLPLVNLEYKVRSSSASLLDGAADLQGTIPARQSKVLTLPAQVSLPDIIMFVGNLRPGQTVPYSADVTLSVDTPVLGRLPIPLGKSGEMKIPWLPGF
jgi:LEA14-like dessication related protein